jgi:hypothetical protein
MVYEVSDIECVRTAEDDATSKNDVIPTATAL